MIDLLYCNFARPADAWWKRACGILDNDDPQATVLRDSARGAGWIREAVRVQHALRTITAVQLMPKYRGILLARRIYEETGIDAEARRWAVEARILAKQTNAQIAKAQGCTRDVIAAYEGLFFNVRDRLQFPDYIWCGLLGRSYTNAPDACDLGMIWKVFAYAGGPHVLEDLMSQSLDGKWVPSVDGICPFLQDQTIATIKQKAAIAAISVPVDSRTTLDLIDCFVNYTRIDRHCESSSTDSTMIEENVKSLLKGFLGLTAIRDVALSAGVQARRPPRQVDGAFVRIIRSA